VSAPLVIDVGSLGAAGFALTGDADYDFAGQSVSSAGDINGDGYDDFIIGAPSYYTYERAAGFPVTPMSSSARPEAWPTSICQPCPCRRLRHPGRRRCRFGRLQRLVGG
jgi:hypothetical protein